MPLYIYIYIYIYIPFQNSLETKMNNLNFQPPCTNHLDEFITIINDKTLLQLYNNNKIEYKSLINRMIVYLYDKIQVFQNYKLKNSTYLEFQKQLFLMKRLLSGKNTSYESRKTDTGDQSIYKSTIKVKQCIPFFKQIIVKLNSYKTIVITDDDNTNLLNNENLVNLDKNIDSKIKTIYDTAQTELKSSTSGPPESANKEVNIPPLNETINVNNAGDEVSEEARGIREIAVDDSSSKVIIQPKGGKKYTLKSKKSKKSRKSKKMRKTAHKRRRT